MPPDETPLVSIVTPSLDQGRYLEEAIESVLAQDYPRIEHVVVDGGSTDDSLEVLRRFPHLRWVSEPDGGQADAIGKGFRMASGEILAWLNADDYYLPGAVSAAVEALRSTGCAVVHGAWRQVDDAGRTIRDVPVVPFDYLRQLERENRVAQPTVFFTRAAYDAVGGVDPSLRYAMDYELWLKLGARFEVCHVDRVLAAYRYHAASKSVAEYARFAGETWRAARRHGARLRSPIFWHFYLPYERPGLHRLLVLSRLLAARDVRAVAAGIRGRTAALRSRCFGGARRGPG
jgi:glycosyltransferase involved in cell wall biosynthesis